MSIIHISFKITTWIFKRSWNYNLIISINSIFPEKIEFDGKKCRTIRINDFLRYILQIDKELPENKKGQISKNMSLSRLVESEGIEPSSKQVNSMLSTSIVFV